MPLIGYAQDKLGFQVHFGPAADFSFPLNAQNINLPLYGGRVMKDVNPDGVGNVVPWAAGGFVEFSYGRMLAIQIEGKYHQWGYTYPYFPNETASIDMVEKFSYTDIPAIIKLRAGGFGFLIGYQYSILNFAERKFDIPDYLANKGNNGAPGMQDWYPSNEFYKDNYGSLVFGFEFRLRKGLGWQVRYTKALDNIVDNSVAWNHTIYSGTSAEIKPDFVSAGMHYAFGRARTRRGVVAD